MTKQSISRKHHKRNKKRTAGKIIFSIFMVLFTILGAIGAYIGWQVYSDLRSTTDDMYEEVNQEAHASRQERPVSVDGGEDPISVLIMGVDTDSADSISGRTDTLMLMTVNPNTDKSTILSIPRDTYTEIVGRGVKDKINHAHAFGGASMAVNTVQNLLDIPVDYYVSVNMSSMMQIIDAVGGITVTPPLSFSQDGYTFTQGQATQMDGAKALSYSRMRKNDPEGDYGRQLRQRQIIEGTISSVASVNSITNYRSLLGSMSESMRTNMSFDDMVDLFSNYRSAAGDVEQLQLRGSSMYINNIYYESIPDEEINRISTRLKSELELN